MDVRSLRMLLGWSREDLAKRSGVPIASVYLIERVGTAGQEDDAVMVRVLLANQKSRSRKWLLVNEFLPAGHSNDNLVVAFTGQPRPPSGREASRAPATRHGDMDGSCWSPSQQLPG